MLTDFFTCLAAAVIALASIIVARGGVEMIKTEGKPAWKAWAGSLALTCVVWLFACEVLVIHYNDHFGKLMALCVVQTVAFGYFRATRPAQAQQGDKIKHG